MKSPVLKMFKVLVLLSAASTVWSESVLAQARNPTYKPQVVTSCRQEPSPAIDISGHMGNPRTEDPRLRRALDQAEAFSKSTPPRFREAEHAYRFAILADPFDTRAYFGLGHIFFTQKRYPEALKAYKDAIAAQPNSPAAHFNMAVTYLRLNNKVEAHKHLKVLKKLKSPLAAKLESRIG